MPLKLSEQEIKQRLIRLRNLERLYANLKNKYAQLKKDHDQLKDLVTLQAKVIEDQSLRIEELERMVFGSKKKKKDKNNSNNDDHHHQSDKDGNGRKRHPSSYRRPKPKDDEITNTKDYPLCSCPDCGTKLSRIKIIERYLEDILPLKDWFSALKKVTKQRITTGYCKQCKTRKTAIPIPPQEVTLGENVKQFVSFSTVILKLSYSQIKDFLEGSVHLQLSEGEITNILMEQAKHLRPEFEALKQRIRGQPGSHYDETTWPVQDEELGKYAWIQTGTETSDTVFLFGRSRGKGNALELQGEDNLDQVGISDDYGAYKKMFKYHQLCWAHPNRKLRDLANSDKLRTDTREHCQQVFESFGLLYKDLRTILNESFDLKERLKQKQELMDRFDQVVAFNDYDPAKLVKIKSRLQERKEHYFTCLTQPGIPADNNKAERQLRHVVLKRRNCLGSKTQRAADMMSVLYSVLLSLWWKSKQSFFPEYAALFNQVG